MTDLALLRAFEPIICFTRGESFYPCAVDAFVASCSLWTSDDDGKATCLVPRGALDLAKLATFDSVPTDRRLFLRYVDEPLQALDYQRWRNRPDHIRFQASGRLARVALHSRIADSLFDLTLLVRGVVPGGTAAAADIQYQELCRRDSRRVYYGRVIRDGGWTVLHYLFFYPMNNWRSGFYGINDHESDWEQVFVYLADDTAGSLAPAWVAYAAHDYAGDDLRRRWDDPQLVKVGTHPVVFAGAGSHGSYFMAGEYLMGAEPTLLVPVKNVAIEIQKFWAGKLGQGQREEDTKQISQLISLPFVDYARGDGLAIGPGQDEEWHPVLISDATPWVDKYRGLWGLDTYDPLGGERAPAGPKYNRNGTVRASWYDPLGWAGLDKVVPPHQAAAELERRLTELVGETAALDREIEAKRQATRTLALEVEALRVTEYFSVLHEQRARQLTQHETELEGLRARRVELSETGEAIEAHQLRIQQGDWGHPQAHIRHIHHPSPPLPGQHRVVEIWAAVSAGLALLALVALLALTPPYWYWWVVAVAVAFAAVETATRRRLDKFVLNAVIVLAIVALLILVWEFWRTMLVLGLIVVIIYMIRDNLRELSRG